MPAGKLLARLENPSYMYTPFDIDIFSRQPLRRHSMSGRLQGNGEESQEDNGVDSTTKAGSLVGKASDNVSV